MKILDYAGPMKIVQYLQSSMKVPALESATKIEHYSQSDIWNCCICKVAGSLIKVENHSFSNMKSLRFSFCLFFANMFKNLLLIKFKNDENINIKNFKNKLKLSLHFSSSFSSFLDDLS